MRRIVQRIAGRFDRVHFCYEAGPTGYGLYRLIRSLGHECTVVAPSLIPRKPGDRVKTNHRDAISLARLLRAGELTAVWVPDEDHEAIRDLVRARAAAVETLRVHRQQVSAFMLKHGRLYPRKTSWTMRYLRWLQEQRFDHPAHQIALQEMVEAVRAYGSELVVVDTISRAIVGEENSNDTWLSLYRHTGRALKAAGVSMARLDHSGKDATAGMRGGSAKSGDVDAVWRLDQITKDTLKLTCTASRMVLSETELVLTRLTSPHLRHKVEGAGWMAAADAAQLALIEALDAAGAPLTIGRPKAREAAKAKSITIGSDSIDRALRARRARAQNLPGADHETEPEQMALIPAPGRSGQVSGGCGE